MSVAVQLLLPVSATRLPGAAPSPQQGQCQGNGEQDMSHIPCSSPADPPRWGTVHVPNLLEAPAELGSLHPLLCLHHIKGLRNDAAWLYIQSAAVPGTQRKLFSNLRWCLDGRTSLGHFMKHLRLGSALVGTLQMSLH